MPESLLLSPPTRSLRRQVAPSSRSSPGPFAPRDRRSPGGRSIRGTESAPGSLSDEALLARYRDARRPEDFAELYRRYAGQIGRYLARYLGDRALAEDALQDCFLQVHTRCDLYRDGRPARSWLYTVAIHKAIDARRRARKLPALRLEAIMPGEEAYEAGTLLDQLASDDPGPLASLQVAERRRWVRERVDRLPEPLRHVLVLAYDRNLSYAEIASLLDVPISCVRSRLHRAVGMLRAVAERYDRAGRD